MSKKEKKKVRKLKENNRILSKENDKLKSQLLQEKNNNHEKSSNKKIKRAIEFLKIFILLLIMMLLYYFVEQYFIPKTIEVIVNDSTINFYIESMMLAENKHELIEFVNKNNQAEYIVTDMIKDEKGVFKFLIERNEEYHEGVVIIPKTQENFILYMVSKFKGIILFDIVTICVLGYRLFDKFSWFSKLTKNKRWGLTLSIMLCMSIGVTVVLLMVYQNSWELGNLMLNYGVKYVCLLVCMYSLLSEIRGRD